MITQVCTNLTEKISTVLRPVLANMRSFSRFVDQICMCSVQNESAKTWRRFPLSSGISDFAMFCQEGQSVVPNPTTKATNKATLSASTAVLSAPSPPAASGAGLSFPWCLLLRPTRKVQHLAHGTGSACKYCQCFIYGCVHMYTYMCIVITSYGRQFHGPDYQDLGGNAYLRRVCMCVAVARARNLQAGA